MTEILLARYKIRNLHRAATIIETMISFKICYTLYIASMLFCAACKYSNDLEHFTNSALGTIVIYSIMMAIANLTTYICKCYIIHNLTLFRRLLLVFYYENKERHISIVEELYNDEDGYTYNLYKKTVDDITNIFEYYEPNLERKYLVRNILLTTDWVNSIYLRKL